MGKALGDPKLGRKERAMARFAYYLPALVLASVLFHAWRNDFSQNFLVAGAILFVASVFLARFLSRRARNLEAAIYTTRVLPADADEKKTFVDVVAILIAGVILLSAVFLPVLKS